MPATRGELATFALRTHRVAAFAAEQNDLIMQANMFFLREDFFGDAKLAVDFLRIVFNPSRLRIVLMMIDVMSSGHPALLIKEHGLGR